MLRERKLEAVTRTTMKRLPIIKTTQPTVTAAVLTVVVVSLLLASHRCSSFPFVPMATEPAVARSGVVTGRSSSSTIRCRQYFGGGDTEGRYSTTRRRRSTASDARLFARTQRKPTDTTVLFDVDVDVDENDYLVLDSLHLRDEDRPSLVDTLQNPRDALALLLLVPFGVSVSICNIFGIYTDAYDYLVEASAWLGIGSGLAGFLQIATNYKITNHSRRLLLNDGAVNGYSGLYALAVSWLALRTGNHCPEWLARTTTDSILSWVCLGVFVLSALVPLVTLWNPGKILDNTPSLTDTELLRARGLLAIGILASVFAPDCLAFGLGGSDWWDRVSELHVSQRTLESSTSLFALYANEASMIAHRCGREGVAPFKILVPAFAGVCLLLAIFPCGAALYWLGNDVSFFSFYRA